MFESSPALRRDVLHDHVTRADEHVRVRPHLDVAQQEAARSRRRVRVDRAGYRPRAAGRAQRVRWSPRPSRTPRSRRRRRTRTRRPGRDGEAVHEHVPRSGRRVVDRDRLLRVSVRRLPGEHTLPVVQLKTNRSRSAPVSDVLPIVARSDVEPAVTLTCTAAAPVRDRGRGHRAAHVVPTARPVNGPNMFVSVYDGRPDADRRRTHRPRSAEHDAPRIEAVIVNVPGRSSTSARCPP